MTHASPLVGTWKLESSEFTGSDGSLSLPFGESPTGVVHYDSNGYMSVQLMRGDRTRFDKDDLKLGTAGEVRAAFEGIITYFGTYSVDETASRVTHHLEGCSFPNWEGTELARSYTIEGDLLTLTTDPMHVAGIDVTGVLTWRKVS